MEQSRDRKDDMQELEDPRVDVCLFAIPPHRCGGAGAAADFAAAAAALACDFTVWCSFVALACMGLPE